MDRNQRKSETLTAPSSHRRRCEEDQVASPEEWRDWASLPGDVLFIVLSRLPQTDILRGAGLVCSPWRRLAMNEPLLWRRIDLRVRDGDPWLRGHDPPPAGWKAMARAAVDRSAGRCESFAGRVDADVLVHLANRAPLLRSLNVAHWPFIGRDKELITEIVKKLPLLKWLVICGGYFKEELLDALLDHCPRLELLDVSDCRPMFRVWEEPIASRISSSTIKHLLLPDEVLE